MNMIFFGTTGNVSHVPIFTFFPSDTLLQCGTSISVKGLCLEVSGFVSP